MSRKLIITAACTSVLAVSAANAETLNIYNAAGFSSYYAEQLVPAFEEATGINVELVSIKNSELAGAVTTQVDSGSSDIHLVIAGDVWISQLENEGLLQPINLDSISNLGNLAGSPAEVYATRWDGIALPSHADYTPVGLFAASVDPESVDTMDELKAFICENPGRWQEGAAGRSGPGNGHKIAIAAALGEDLEDPDSWSAAWDYMSEYANCVREFTSGTGATIKAMAAGENLAIPMNYGWQAELRYKGEIPADSQLVNPYGVTFVAAHGMAIVETVEGSTYDAAIEFLNFQLSDEAQVLITNTIHYPLTLSGWAASDAEMRDATTEAVVGITFEDFAKEGNFSAMPSGEAQNRAYSLWEEKIAAGHSFSE